MMPGEDGLSLAGFVRATSSLPVSLPTAKAEETGRIAGLELGADDYVTKPFSPRAGRQNQGYCGEHLTGACERRMPMPLRSVMGCWPLGLPTTRHGLGER